MSIFNGSSSEFEFAPWDQHHVCKPKSKKKGHRFHPQLCEFSVFLDAMYKFY